MSVRKRWQKLRWYKQIGVIIAASVVIGALGGGAFAQFGPSLTQSTTTGVNLTKGLVGWWKMDSNPNDSSVNRLTVGSTALTSTTDRKGKANAAYSFNGTSSYLNGSSQAVTNMAKQDWTISAWVKTTNTTNTLTVVSRRNGGPTYGYNLNIVGGLPYAAFYLPTPGTISVTGSTSVADGSWHHIVAQYVRSGQLTLYVDGVSVATAAIYNYSTSNIQSVVGDPLYLGRDSYANNNYFIGSMDDVRIYSRALNTNEIKTLYQQYDPSIKLAAGENRLVGWWKFDNNAQDSTPYRNTLTVTGGISKVADRKNTPASAYQLTAATVMKVNSAPNLLMHTSDWSLSAWINTTTGSGQKIIEKRGPGYGLSVSGTGRVSACLYESANHNPADVCVSSTTIVNDGTWHLVSVTYVRSGLMTVYIDGTPAASTSIAAYAAYDIADNGSLCIGSDATNGSTRFIGSIDDARIYSRALSANEIKNLYGSYNSQINANSYASKVNLSTGLIAYWAMNGNINDITPYRNTGSLLGTTSLTTDRNNRASSAYSFDGVNSGIQVVPWRKLSGNAPRTMAAWFKTTSSSSSTGMIIDWGGSTAGTGSYLRFTGGTLGVDTTSCSANTSQTPYIDGNWHFVAGTISGTANVLYVDGIYKAATNCVANTASSDLAIGRGDSAAGTLRFIGSIDDVRVYNRVLSAAEITALYAEYR